MRPMAWMDEGLGQMTKLREHYFNGGKITWHDFKRSRKQRLELEAIEKSVKLGELRKINESDNMLVPSVKFIQFPQTRCTLPVV